MAYRNGLVQPELFEKKNGEWEKIKDITEAAMQDILEIAIPFKDIKAKAEDELNLFITAYRGNEEIERCPWRGNISVTVPTPDFEATMWYWSSVIVAEAEIQSFLKFLLTIAT